jgi:hypothetical protein
LAPAAAARDLAWDSSTSALMAWTGGIGHNLPQEAPQAFAVAIIDVDAL